jgi:hypothetical protein
VVTPQIEHCGLGQHRFRDAVAPRARALPAVCVAADGAEMARALDDAALDRDARRLKRRSAGATSSCARPTSAAASPRFGNAGATCGAHEGRIADDGDRPNAMRGSGS